MSERAVMPGLEDETDGLYCVTCEAWRYTDDGGIHDGHAIAPAVLSDRWIVNPLTGEILGMVEPDVGRTDDAGNEAPFRVRDRGSAEWVLERIFEAELELEALARRREILLENIAATSRPIVHRIAWLRKRFEPELEEWARRELEGQKTRTIRTPFGTLAFRKRPKKISVRDEELAIAWAEEHRPAAVKVTKKILVSALDPKTIPAELFELDPGGDSFSLKTGAGDGAR